MIKLPTSRRSTTLVFSLPLLVFAVKVLGCSEAPAVLDIGWTHTCKTTADCSDGIPGSFCDAEAQLCVCQEEGHRVCCAKGYRDVPKGQEPNCDQRCRAIEQCDPEPPPDHCPFTGAASSGGPVGGGGEGGAGGAVGAGGAGGVGGVEVQPECVLPGDCPQPPDLRCGYATCEEGKCGLVFTPGPADSQVRGDCKTIYCDTMGNAEEKPDDGDYYNDGKVCTLDICKNGVPTNNPYPDTLTCPEVGYGVCYQGDCVECIDGLTQCPTLGTACDGGFFCVPGECSVDQKCGVGCAPCPPLAGPCAEASDCLEGVCIGGMCAVPSCADGVKNDGEIGTDCGAPSCQSLVCPDGETCGFGADCASGVCWGGFCQTPTCTDGVMNANELGVDCGGDCAMPCPAPAP